MDYQLCTLLVLACVTAVLCQPTMEENPDGMGGKLSFKPPSLNDEESHSSFMPANLRCDACWAIAFQFRKYLKKANEMFKSRNGDLPESEILDAFEKACSSKTFENYGLKEVKKVKRLSGDGIPDPVKNAAGMMQGGGKWPGRMLDMCETYIGEIGESELYSNYRENLKKKDGFRKYLCYGDKPPLDACSKMKNSKEEL